VTLINRQNSTTHGIAYLLVGAEQIAAALKHLYYREVVNGYCLEIVKMQVDSDDGNIQMVKLTILLTRFIFIFLVFRSNLYCSPTQRRLAWRFNARRSYCGTDF
jgi:hypothetical protein